jgi:hypothetical protein
VIQSTKFEADHQPTDCPDARPHGAAIAIADEVIEQIITTHARRLLRCMSLQLALKGRGDTHQICRLLMVKRPSIPLP